MEGRAENSPAQCTCLACGCCAAVLPHLFAKLSQKNTLIEGFLSKPFDREIGQKSIKKPIKVINKHAEMGPNSKIGQVSDILRVP
jgi:hypothetical protein